MEELRNQQPVQGDHLDQPSPQVFQDLCTARKILTRETWTKGSAIVAGKYCAMTAIAHTLDITKAAKGDHDQARFEACRALLSREVPDTFLVDEHHRSLGLRVVAYNDDIYTTLDDILALYDRAIAAAQKVEGGRKDQGPQ